MNNTGTNELPGSRRGYQLIKRLLDVLISAVALLLLLPVMLLIALLIFLQDGGSPLYSQIRLGRGGKEIRIRKFRSMKPGADASLNLLTPAQQERYLAEFKIEPDPRVTRLGAFLRRTCLDELPQLWNILRGDMSLVGPRPVLPQEISKYAPEEQAVFLSVRPGLTGYWQSCAGPEDTYTSGKRQQMELHYARNASLAFDLQLILQTFRTVVRKAAEK